MGDTAFRLVRWPYHNRQRTRCQWHLGRRYHTKRQSLFLTSRHGHATIFSKSWNNMRPCRVYV
jgi:hypothetical protein